MPTALLVGSQALWFAVPVGARALGLADGIEPFSRRHAEYSFYWIAAAHAVQYLWVTVYFAERSGQAPGSVQGVRGARATYAAKVLLAGSAIWGVPALLFAPGVLGDLPFDVGLGAMVAAAVNLHHFVLDGTIWKLRDDRVGRVLLPSAERDEAEGAADLAPTWRSALVWITGAVCLSASVIGVLELQLGARHSYAAGDVTRLEAASDRLRWVGRDHPTVRLHLGLLKARGGDLDGSLEELERSLALHPLVPTWVAVGDVHALRKEVPEALEAYEAALGLDPRNRDALTRAGYTRIALGEREEGQRLLDRAGEGAGAREGPSAPPLIAIPPANASPSPPTAPRPGSDVDVGYATGDGAAGPLPPTLEPR